MFAELGQFASVLLTVAGIVTQFLTQRESLQTTAAGLIVVGAVSRVLQLWIYYRRWHNS